MIPDDANDDNSTNGPVRRELADAQDLLRELHFHQAELKKFKLEYQEFQQQMEYTWEHYADLYDLMPVGCFTLDEKGRTLEVNQTGAAMLGLECTDITGKHFVAWLTEDDRPQFINHLRQAFQSRSRIAIELKTINQDGILCDVRLESTVVAGAGKQRVCLMVMTDLGERKKADEASSLASCLIDTVTEGIMITDEKMIIRSVNSAFEKTTGYSAGEVIGHTPALLKSGQHGNNFYKEMWDTLNKCGEWRGEVWNRHKNGEIYPEWLKISVIKDSRQNVVNYVGIFSDTHTQKYILERLHYLAYYDGLTGLPNRRLFLDRLNMSLFNARRDNHILAVIFVDLDQFKQVNDTLGHKAGDNLLVAVAERMKGCLREVDTLARFGGDEFAILLPVISHPDDASNIARKFLDCCDKPLNIDGRELHMTASIGISVFPKDGEDVDGLLGNADHAMYQIKGAGRNGYLHYSNRNKAKP